MSCIAPGSAKTSYRRRILEAITRQISPAQRNGRVVTQLVMVVQTLLALADALLSLREHGLDGVSDTALVMLVAKEVHRHIDHPEGIVALLQHRALVIGGDGTSIESGIDASSLKALEYEQICFILWVHVNPS